MFKAISQGTSNLSEFTVFRRLYRFLDPCAAPIESFEDDKHKIMALLRLFNSSGTPEKPLNRVMTKETPLVERVIIMEVMKLEFRDRPTAQALLQWMMNGSMKRQTMLGRRLEAILWLS